MVLAVWRAICRARRWRFAAGRCVVAVRRLAGFCLLGVLLAGVLPARGWAQTPVDGAIGGVVEDAGGAALAGAMVTARGLATGVEVAGVSGPNGEFRLAGLAPGSYSVTVEYERFASMTLGPVTVEVGAVISVEARLRVGSVMTSVTVSAGPAAVVSADDQPPAAVASVVTPAEIEMLPVDGRRWQTFALLTPTAHADPEGDGLLSFRGVASTQNSSRIDGGSDDQSFGAVPRGTGVESTAEFEDAAESGPSARTGGGGADGEGGYARHAGAAYTFSQEAVREFRVSGQNYSALYGQAAGGIISTVSKSGTNRLHGSAFYLVQSSALAATNPFAIATNYVDGAITRAYVKPHDLRQQFGGSVGGAAVRDRIFYFYTYDQQRRNFPAISSPQDPNFYALTAMQSALLANRGVRPEKVNAALNYLNSLSGPVARRQDQTINFAKVDWQATEKHRLGLQYNRARSSSPAGVRSSPVVDVGTGTLGSSYAKVDAVLGRWRWSARPSVSNEVRLQYGHDLQYEVAQRPLPQEPATGPGGYAPEVAIGPYGFTFGTASSLGRKAYPDERRIEMADLLTWVHGGHQVQVGADVSLVHDDVVGLNDIDGAFHYDSGVTSGHAGGLVDWITDYTFNVNAYPNGGCPSIHATLHYFCFRSFTQAFGQQAVSFDTQEWAGFVQEDWRLRDGLSVNVGLRYEYELLPLPQQPNLALDTAFGGVGATSVFPEDRNNVGPRAGLAWQPFGMGHGVLRVGYGLFYGRLPGATIRSALLNTALPSSSTRILILPTTVTNCPQVENQGFGYPCAYVAAPPAAVARTTQAMLFDKRFRLPAVQQGSLTFEREVGGGVVGSATYLMNLDRQLPNSVDINIAPATGAKLFQLQGGTGAVGVRDGETFVVPVYAQRVNPAFGPVTDIVSNADASYNALVMEGRRRSPGGFDFRVSWTWSKAIDFGQSAGATPRTNGQFDPFNVRYDRGLSALNHPHKEVASVVWAPKLQGEAHWMRSAVNGWAVSSIFSESSGRPYSYNLFGGTRLTGGHETINGSGGAVYLPTVGRNTLRLPDSGRVDLRLARVFRAGENVRVRGMAEVFNLTNHVNYSSISQRAYMTGPEVNGVTPLIFQDAATVAAEGLNVLPFGAYTATSSFSPERRVQLGLRMDF